MLFFPFNSHCSTTIRMLHNKSRCTYAAKPVVWYSFEIIVETQTNLGTHTFHIMLTPKQALIRVLGGAYLILFGLNTNAGTSILRLSFYLIIFLKSLGF